MLRLEVLGEAPGMLGAPVALEVAPAPIEGAPATPACAAHNLGDLHL